MLYSLLACTDPSGERAAPGDSSAELDTAFDGGDSGMPPTFDETVDVLVIGAGPAGLAAAAEVVAAGATVLVLERETWAGGACNDAAVMFFAGTPEQAALGIEDSPERLAADWNAFTGGDADDPWFAYFAENHVAMVKDWLAERGLQWGTPTADSGSGDVERIFEIDGWGPELVAVLLDQIPNDAVRYEASASTLLVDGGHVVGASWTDLASGSSHSIGADAVIVATGGFQYDLERVKALIPDVATSALRRGSFINADGNGHDMLSSVGAVTQNLDALGFYAHATFHPDSDTGELTSQVFGEYPLVAGDGLRFADDSDAQSFVLGRTRALLPGESAWLVSSGQIRGMPFANPDDVSEVWSVDQLVEAGVIIEANDVTELASTMGIDGAALSSEVDAWNAAVRGEVDDPWRDEAGMAEVGPPPFYAMPVAATAAKAFGGIDVDLSGRVIDDDGVPIPGAYAAGELTGMLGGSIVGEHGFTGSLTAVVLGGRVAGMAAAGESTGGE